MKIKKTLFINIFSLILIFGFTACEKPAESLEPRSDKINFNNQKLTFASNTIMKFKDGSLKQNEGVEFAKLKINNDSRVNFKDDPFKSFKINLFQVAN